jgi:hypothetical protein
VLRGSGHALRLGRLEAIEKVDGALCVCRSREYRTLVLAEKL